MSTRKSKYWDGNAFVKLGVQTPDDIDAAPIDHNHDTKYSLKTHTHVKANITDLSLTASEVNISDSGNNYTSTNVEGALSELFQSVSSGKSQIATAITGKGVTTSSGDSFTTMASKINSIQVGTPDLHGTLSFTGTYNSSTYVQPQGSSMGSNFATKEVFIIVQGGTSASYGNIVFELLTAPSGVTLASSMALYTHASAPASQHFGCVLRGVNQKINVSVNMSAINTTYDWAKAALTVTYA